MSTLVHLAYASQAVADFPDAALAKILERARSTNASLGVTGILLHVDRSFFQILEGEADVLAPLYAKIALDKRHARVAKLIEEPLDHRDFANWSMGLANATTKELAAVPGLNDFFTTRRTLDSMDEGTSRRLLGAFREGRWRARVGP